MSVLGVMSYSRDFNKFITFFYDTQCNRILIQILYWYYHSGFPQQHKEAPVEKEVPLVKKAKNIGLLRRPRCHVWVQRFFVFSEANQKQVDEFKDDLQAIEEFMTKVDARSLSIPAKLANMSEVSQLKCEFQVRSD